jgi:hypothetical protein
MVIFSKQRSGQGVFKLIEEIVKTMPPRPLSYFYDNPTKLTDHGIENDQRLRYLKDVIDKKIINTNANDDEILFLRWFNINEIFKNSSSANTTKLNT